MTNCCTDKFAAQALGVVFLLVMLLGFTPNPLLSPDGIFAVNGAHNMVHGLFGLALLALANAGYGRKALLVSGIIYVLLGIYGYWMKGDMMLGFIKCNMADNYLHLGLGIVLIAVGVLAKPERAKKKG